MPPPRCLTVSEHALGVATLPSSTMRATHGIVGTMSLHSQSTMLLAGGSQAAALAMLVHGIDDPVDARIIADRYVVRVNENHLEVLVGGILVDPVRVQDAQVGADAASTLLSHAAQVAHKLQLVDTLILGLSVDDTLVVGSLAATPADSNTVHNVALLGLVSELVSLIGTSGAVNLLHLLGLAVLPSPG